MNAGELKHRVAIQENTPTENAYGERQASWATIETVYAKIKSVSAYESLRAGRDLGDVSHQFVIRYRTDFGSSDVSMHPKFRFTYNSRTFEVLSAVDVNEEHRWLECMTREVV